MIDWLHESTINEVARRFVLSLNANDGIMRRAVKRNLARRKRESVKHIGVDEIAIKKGHQYVTIVSNEQGCVLAVESDRNKESLASFYRSLKSKAEKLETISMDMSNAYLSATKAHIDNWQNVVCFDRFHVMQELNKTANLIRKMEARKSCGPIREQLHKSRFC